MNDRIEVGAQSSGEEGINRLTSALDRLEGSLAKLGGNNNAMTKMAKQFADMNKTMTAGFDTLIELQSSMEARSQRMAEVAGARRLAQEEAKADRIVRAAAAASEKKLQQQIDFEQKQEGSANKFHYKQIELQDTLQVKQIDSYIKFWEKIVAAQVAGENTQKAIQERRDVELHTMAVKAAADYVSLWEKMLGERQAIQERRDVELHAARQREFVDYVSWWDKALAEQASKQAKQLEMERAQQTALAAIRRAQITSTNAAIPAGASVIASGNPAAVGASRTAIEAHNAAMNEGHALARGLAGSLGGLWLTYGSLVPLVAGAALAASLKHIVTVGKDVENQLNFVFALSSNREGVNLDQFLKINDTSLHSIVEAASAMRALAQNGLSASQSLQVLPAILDLSTVGEMSVAQAALAATGAVSAFGLSYAEAGRVGDIFAKTAAESNTSVLAITESMKQASTVASLFKVSIEETAGVLGVLAKINITGGAAGTSMTNMLTGLYEPTEKGKKALKELGIETMTASGALKPFTQLMEELRGSLSNFNDSAKVDFLGSIFTVRGVKSVQQVQENLDEYKKKVGEAATATGFMRTVVMQLEDSTDGAFKRLGVSVERTFVQSFKEASPYVQQIGLHLADAFKDGGATQTGLTNLATNVARLTDGLLNNLAAVGFLAVAYVGFRALAPVIALFNAATAASAASTVASAAATVATELNTAALARGTATRALHVAAIEAQTVATVAGTAASAAWAAILLPALGALAVAVAGAAALWLLFRDNTDAADQANTKLSNSLHVVTEQLDKEIERLEKSAALWNAREGRFNKEGQVTPEVLVQADNQVREIERRIRASGADPEKVRNAEVTIDAGTGMSSVSYVHELSDALAKADANLAGFQEQNRRFTEKVAPLSAAENIHKATDQLGSELEKFAKKGSEVNSKGEFYQQDEAIRNLYKQAGALKQELIDPLKIFADPKEEAARIDGLRTSLKQLTDQVNSSQASRAPKVDQKASNDALNADLKRLDLGLQLQKLESQSNIANAKQQNKRGELGDLELINVELAEKLALDQKGVEVARQQYLLTTDAKNKVARGQEYTNKSELAKAQAVVDTQAASEARLSVLDRMAKEEQKLDAKTMADKGEYVKAFLSDYEATYGTTVERVTADLIANEGTIYEEGLSRYLSYLAKLKQAGTDDARGKELKDNFAVAFDTLGLRLQTLSNNSGPGAGLSAIFDNALRAEQTYANALPDLLQKQAEMQALADSSHDPKDQKSATEELRRIEAAGARVRNIWVDIGKDIQKSLTDAFGKPGAALGGLIAHSLEYATKQKQIDADLAKSSVGADPGKLADLQKKAAKDSASAQISAYGDMAGAAKGFFSEQSGGYKILATAEKAFRIAELAMTFEAMAAKLFATTTVTTAKVTASTIEAGAAAATVPVVIAAEGAKSSAYGITALAAALALPFPANLPAFAIVAGMLAAIGVAVAGSGGGGGVPLSQERQEKNGTGSVLGDSKAKSESIAKSLALIEKNTYQDLSISNNMLTALQNIEAGIGGLGALVARSLGQGTSFGDMKGSNNALGGSAASMVGIGAAAGAKLGSFFGPWGTAIGAVGGAILGALSRVKVDVQDQGLSLNTKSLGDTVRNGATGSTYADINTKKSFLGITYSNRNDRNSQALPAETLQQVTMVIDSMRSGILAAADAIGVGGDSFIAKLDAIAVSIPDISTKGLTGEEIQKALESAFGKLGDDLAKTAMGGMEQFQKVGEGYLETVMRVAAGYQTIDVIFQSFGKVFGQVGLESIPARQRLIDLSGGLENFTAQSEFFLKNFFTPAEQAAALKDRIDPTLQKYGLSTAGADATKLFKDFIVALNTTTAAGAQTYAELMNIAPAFKAVIDGVHEANSQAKDLQDQIDELTMTRVELLNKEREALDPANRALFDNLQIQKKLADAKTDVADAYDREVTAITAANDRLKTFGDGLRTFRNSLVLGNLSPLTPEQKYVQAKSQFEQTLAKAQSGDTKAQDGLQAAMTAFLDASRVSNASGGAYTTDFQKVTAAADLMATWADSQVDIGKASLEQLKKQIGALVDIKTAVLTLPEALAALLKATPAGQQNTTPGAYTYVSQASALATITKIYNDLLGRTPEAAGIDFWTAALKNGVTADAMAAAVKQSTEYLASHPTTVVETMHNASSQVDTNGVAPAVSMQAIADELRRVREQLEKMETADKEGVGAQIDAAYASTAAAADTSAAASIRAAQEAAWARQNHEVIQ